MVDERLQGDDLQKIDRALSLLEAQVRSLGDMAAVESAVIPGTVVRTVSVEPVNPRARRINIIGEQWLVVQIGTIGGRWELDYDAAGIQFARDLIEATVAGRVAETFDDGCTRVDVTFGDGSRHHESGCNSDARRSFFAPLRRQRIAGPEVQYEPYETHKG